jgi:hypothetical protein
MIGGLIIKMGDAPGAAFDPSRLFSSEKQARRYSRF